MIKQRVAELILAGIEAAQAQGSLPAVAIPDLGLERPTHAEHGDYASSVALRLARSAKMSPRSIAETIQRLIPPSPEIAAIEIAGAGFLNVRLDDRWIASQVDQILVRADRFGGDFVTSPERIQVEYVSANPVGPLHVGTARNAVLGDTIANVLAYAGHQVQREYYLNDAGAQIRTFGRTLLARYRQAFGEDAPIPEDGYAGQYMIELAERVKAEHGDRLLSLAEDDAISELTAIGSAAIIDGIRADLESLDVRFDQWFSERSLLESGQVDAAIERLRAAGVLDQREGALWFSSTAFGEDKDNVIIRSTGVPTYFATDIAYHYDKFGPRGFDRVIDVWGADHQGHVSRMKAVVSALGFSPEALTVVLFQLVTLKRGGEIVRLSKRTGDIVTLRELIDEVGPDACRFFLLQRSADSQMDFDIELAKEQSDTNPVYYVQYAHARIASILRKAAERGLTGDGADLNLIQTEPELTLIRKMLQLPEIVELAAENLEPHWLPHYAHALAGTFHSFYKHCPVLQADPALTRARLRLVAASKQVLANALRLMGVAAPERMDRADEPA